MRRMGSLEGRLRVSCLFNGAEKLKYGQPFAGLSEKGSRAGFKMKIKKLFKGLRPRRKPSEHH